MDFIALTGLIVLIQMLDSWLRYVSFRNTMTKAEKINLARRFAVCAVFCAVVYAFTFYRFGIISPIYKFFLMTGWIPWLVVFMLTVRRNFLAHIFIFTMSFVWVTSQHNWSAIIVIFFDDFIKSETQIILSHAALYPLLFLIFLPLERHFFSKLLPPKDFFKEYGKLIAFLPFIVISGSLFLWIQEPVVHSWAERFSRTYIPFVFFFFYTYILNSTERLNEKHRMNRNLRRMKEQIAVLTEYNRLMQVGHEKIAVMRHDLRHSYRLIDVMLQKKDFAAIKEYVSSQESLLTETVVKNFCAQPLVNAALSFYLSRAENLGISVRYKVNLPEKIAVDENDLALLVSNLLENAVNACSKPISGEKIISVTIQNRENQCVLEIINSCGANVNFDEKNYPQASEEGHGFGMESVKLFSRKYHAYTDFQSKGGFFKVTMYWRF